MDRRGGFRKVLERVSVNGTGKLKTYRVDPLLRRWDPHGEPSVVCLARRRSHSCLDNQRNAKQLFRETSFTDRARHVSRTTPSALPVQISEENRRSKRAQRCKRSYGRSPLCAKHSRRQPLGSFGIRCLTKSAGGEPTTDFCSNQLRQIWSVFARSRQSHGARVGR